VSDDADPAPDPEALLAAATAIRRGDLVVFPTETVYGLGADALDPEAVERVFEAKGRDRDDPLSLAVPDVDGARAYVRTTPRTRRFMREFLPGPVTVICGKRAAVPDALTGGRDRVGVRVPDHETALALLERVAPVTATSANRSGAGGVRRTADLDEEIRAAAAVVLDDGETPGGESTVVDVERGEIHRRGRRADAVADWLAEQ
jgi:L-threonylcarbamoyladenylate synthase